VPAGRSRWSVRRGKLGVADQGNSDVEAALLAAGKPSGAFAGTFFETDQADHLFDRARITEVAGVELKRLADRQRRLQSGALEHDADLLAPFSGRVGRIDPEHFDLTVVPPDVPLEDLNRGRLAGAVGAQHGEDLFSPDFEIDALHSLELAVGLAQPLDGYDWIRHSMILGVRTRNGS